jgi:hypothetical protein
VLLDATALDIEDRIDLVALRDSRTRRARRETAPKEREPRPAPRESERDAAREPALATCHAGRSIAVLEVDLTIPILIVSTAVAIVLAMRAWASALDRAARARTDALLRKIDEAEGARAPEAGDATRTSDEERQA